MTSRDRVLRTLSRREPDRVPYNLRPGPDLVERLRAQVGDVAFEDHFGHDVRYVGIALAERPPGVPIPEWTPAPAPQAIEAAAQAAGELQARGLAVCGSYACGVFEEAKYWLGDPATLTGPYDDPKGFGALLDRITEWKCAVYGGCAAAGVDIVWIGDDLGTQRSLVMSPAHYRAWYWPRHRRIVAHLRAIRPDVKIAFHCCGHVTLLVPELIEAGVDVLEAVQPEAMDLPFLKREFGRDLAFWGGIGAQSILQLPSPGQTREGVLRTLRTMAPGGGYICAPCHTLTEGVPWENVLAFYEAVWEHHGEKG